MAAYNGFGGGPLLLADLMEGLFGNKKNNYPDPTGLASGAMGAPVYNNSVAPSAYGDLGGLASGAFGSPAYNTDNATGPTRYGMSSMMPLLLTQLGGVAAIGANNPAMAAFSQVGQQMATGTLEDVYMRELRKDPMATPPPMLDRNAARLMRQEVMQTEEFKAKRVKSDFDMISKMMEMGFAQEQIDLARQQFADTHLTSQLTQKKTQQEIDLGEKFGAREAEVKIKAMESQSGYWTNMGESSKIRAENIGQGRALSPSAAATEMVNRYGYLLPPEVKEDYLAGRIMGDEAYTAMMAAIQASNPTEAARIAQEYQWLRGLSRAGAGTSAGALQSGGAGQKVPPLVGAVEQEAPPLLQRTLSPADIAAITPFVSANGQPRGVAPMNPEQFDNQAGELHVAPNDTRFKVTSRFVIIADDPPGAPPAPTAPAVAPASAPFKKAASEASSAVGQTLLNEGIRTLGNLKTAADKGLTTIEDFVASKLRSKSEAEKQDIVDIKKSDASITEKALSAAKKLEIDNNPILNQIKRDVSFAKWIFNLMWEEATTPIPLAPIGKEK